MTQIYVVKADGSKLALYNPESVSAPTKATQKMALLSDDLLSITVASAVPLDFELGDIVNVYGKGYRLNQLPQVTKLGSRRYSYELQLEGAQYDLLDVSFQLPEGSYGDNLYGDLPGFINALSWNVQRIFGTKWVIKTSLTGTAHKNLSVSGKNCLQVAQELCNEYGVEFSVTITGSTRTMEFVNKVGTTQPFTLKYGEGKGLYQLQRTNVNNAGVTTRLYCYGSGENLPSGYGHTKLLLPGKTRLTSFVEDDEAIALYGVKEGEKSFPDIRPERIGKVTAQKVGDVLTFIDTDMDFDLNEKDAEGNTKYLIPDTVAQIKFVSGNLGGYTFDLHSYDHATKQFKINQFTDENGVKFPDASTGARQFGKHDEYIILQINLPQSYITAAEEKLEKEGTAALAKISQPQVSYKLQLDENFFIAAYGREDTEFLHVGDSIKVEDAEVGISKEVRITRIERDLLRPHSYDITLSDTVTKSTTIKVINDITEINEVIQNSGIADTSKMRRRWMATKELQEMVFDTEGNYYSDKIAPLSIETTMLTVAAKSQQFTLVGSLFQPNLGGDCNDFYAQACGLVHYALLEEVVTFQLSGCTYSADNGNALITTTAYYIYARCSKVLSTGNMGSGTIILSTQQHKADETSYYYFLIGVLNSAVDGVRAISLTYGATTINGAFITTGRIQSQDENTFIDLDGNAFVMGNGGSTELSWNKNNDGKLRIKGGLVVNGGGDEDTIGLYRGVYSAYNTYYPGDEVSYTSSNVTSTYRRIGTASTRGIAPTNTTYWQVLAKGVRGSFKARCFKRTNTDISDQTPTGGTYDSPVATGWSDGIPSGTEKLWSTVCTFYSDGNSSGWSAPSPETDTATVDIEFSPSPTQPSAPSGSTPYANHESEGWYDPSSPRFNDWERMIWRAERKVRNGVYEGSWTITRIYGEKGDPGSPGGKGADAPYYKYKYQWSGSRTAYPTPFDATALNAGSDNWKDTQPAKPGTLYYLWHTIAKVSADGKTLLENWSTPVRTTPVENSLKIEVRGTRHNGASVPAAYVKVYGSDITGTVARGHNLKVLNASDLSVAFQATYDTYSDTRSSQTATTNLYNKLTQYASANYIIVLFSSDAVSMLSKLYGYLQKFGCNYKKPELIASRFAFAFIGRWGLKPGQGYTKSSASEDTVDVAASVIDGELVANGSDGQPGDNLVDNSEIPETHSITDSSTNPQYFTLEKTLPTIPDGLTISGQARITLSGCTFPTAGARVLIYINSSNAWPTICVLNGITANGTYDLKTELTQVPTGVSSWNKNINVRLDNFYTGGTITIERVKVEEGGVCSEWTPSQNDRRGASTPYRGIYDSSKTYYGTIRRTDVVKYNEVYYVARADVGTFSNKLPTNTDYWNDYGAQFESVATLLLLAELANIAGFIFRNNRLESQKLADGTTTDRATTKDPMILLDGLTGLAKLAGGRVVFKADGSVQIGAGSKLFTIDTSGNVKMANIDAEGGTFSGVIKADGGLILKTQTISTSMATINKGSVLVVYTGATSGTSDKTMYFPKSPNTGQMLIIKNEGGNQLQIDGNGHKIAGNGLVGDDYPGNKIYLTQHRAKEFVFDGSFWQQVNQYDY